jgi:hypothetical protein
MGLVMFYGVEMSIKRVLTNLAFGEISSLSLWKDLDLDTFVEH